MADVKIKSGASSDQLTVDATSKAMRIIRVKSDGSFSNKVPAGIYMLPVNLHDVNIGSQDLAIRNSPSATVSMYIRQIYLRFSFLQTAAAADQTRFNRFSGAAYAGGTTLTPLKLQAAFPASQVSDARNSSVSGVLTSAGVTLGNEFGNAYVPANPGASIGLKIKLYDANDPDGMIKITPGEGLVITNDFRNGRLISGFVIWEER